MENHSKKGAEKESEREWALKAYAIDAFHLLSHCHMSIKCKGVVRHKSYQQIAIDMDCDEED